MSKQRIIKLEQSINKKLNLELPLFLETVGESIIFNESLLRFLKVDPTDYPEYTKESLVFINKGRVVPKTAEFISHFTGEDYAPNCYLHLKGYEHQRIILQENES